MINYIIENQNGDLWSNEEGWTKSDNYDTFDEAEKDLIYLPLDGKWVKVLRTKE